VGNILSGWRYDISGLSPAMRTDYEQHLTDCSHCRRRQQVARTIDVLLISVSTLSIAAFQVGMYGWMLLAHFVLFPMPDLEANQPLFWMMMQVAMVCGFFTSLPMNWWLVKIGWKERM